MWLIPPKAAIFAVDRLAEVDYEVANRVTHLVANVVRWSYEHDMPIFAVQAVQGLQFFDDIGSSLITAVIWIVMHSF
jgi:hypothetical protein